MQRTFLKRLQESKNNNPNHLKIGTTSLTELIKERRKAIFNPASTRHPQQETYKIALLGTPVKSVSVQKKQKDQKT